MKKRALGLGFALVIVLSLAVSSCSAVKSGVGEVMKGKIEQGAWSADGKTFTNEWSSIKFTMPATGFTAASKEEIDEMMRVGMEAIGQTGLNTDIAEMSMVYDFVVSADVGMPSLMLVYENIKFNAAVSKADENGYLDVLKTQLAQLEAQGYYYTEHGRSTVTIAGIEWRSASYSLNDVVMQDYYLHLSDGYMWQIVITYGNDSDSEAAVKVLIEGFAAAE